MSVAVDSERPATRMRGWGGLVRCGELMVPTLKEIREHRPLLPPLLLGWIAAWVTAAWTVPLVEVALPGEAAGAAPLVRGWMWAMAALAPLVQAGRALVWTATGWALLALVGRSASGRRLFSVFLYGEALIGLYGMGLAIFFHWSLEPGTSGATFLDPLSLEAYVPSSHGFGSALVRQLSLIRAGWVGFVALAGRRVLGLGVRGAWTWALTLWLGSVAVATARTLLNG